MYTYQFLYIHNCLVPLKGRDIINKLQAQIMFGKGQFILHASENKTVETQVLTLQRSFPTDQTVPEDLENAVIRIKASEIPRRLR